VSARTARSVQRVRRGWASRRWHPAPAGLSAGPSRPAAARHALPPAHAPVGIQARALTGARPRQIRELEDALRAATARAADAETRIGAPGADRPEVGLGRSDPPLYVSAGDVLCVAGCPRTACSPPRRAARMCSQVHNAPRGPSGRCACLQHAHSAPFSASAACSPPRARMLGCRPSASRGAGCRGRAGPA